MRKLMWFTVGFAAASAFCTYTWATDGLKFPSLIFALLFVVLLGAGMKWELLCIPGVVCLGIGAGLFWFSLYGEFYLSYAQKLDGQIADVTARCTDYSYETGYGTGVDSILYLDGKSYRARLYVNGHVEMKPGDVLTGAFRFQVAAPEGELDNPSYPGKGIFLAGYQEEDAELKKLAEPPAWAYPAILRKTLLNLLDASFPADAAPFAKALLLGDRTDIDYETASVLQVSGIMHVIAVSGLHVTILFGLIRNLCLRRRWISALLGIPMLGLFALVGGFSPSIIRACIMQVLMVLASLVDREYDGPTELAFACLVMLACNPLVVMSVSFQLSTGCVAGILLVRNSAYERMLSAWNDGILCRFPGVGRKVCGSVAMSLSSMVFTAPLTAWHFGTVSLVGIVNNLLSLWLVTLLFCGIVLVCVTGWFFPGMAGLLGSVLAYPVRGILALSGVLSRLPLAAVYTRSVYIVVWLVFCYVLLAIFCLVKDKRPGLLAGCVGISLCLALAASWLEPMTDSCRMTVLNVGQGQCILLQSDGRTYLVDCGGSRDRDAADLAARTLLSQGISHVDGVILTHYDRDHAGGAIDFLSRIPADAIFLPDVADDSGVSERLQREFPDRVVMVSRDLVLTYGGTEISVFAPAIPDSGNESALAVLFRKENCDILITGDRSGFAERMLLKTGRIPDLEILVVGHHGSKHSTCEEFLAATTPEIAVISVGENSFGHPAQEVLDRLAYYGCIVYRTDIHGNLTFRR